MYTAKVLGKWSKAARFCYATGRRSAETVLAAFLELVADSDGFSFFSELQMCELLGLTVREFREARQRLITAGIIAFVSRCSMAPNGYYRVLARAGNRGRSRKIA